MTALVIGDLELSSEEVAIKLEHEIAFLVDRLRKLESQRVPNAVMLKTYRDMLDSRYVVLKWLRKGSHKLTSNG